jgi:hypothetical protein
VKSVPAIGSRRAGRLRHARQLNKSAAGKQVNFRPFLFDPIPGLLGQNSLHVLAISVAQYFLARPLTSVTAQISWSRLSPGGAKVARPSFFGFIFKFALPFLVPVLLTIRLFFSSRGWVTILKHFLCAHRLFSED